jgi:hypothetical protein
MLGPVLELAAIRLVDGAWRNTCVESWHVEGRMRDRDMLRVNSHSTPARCLPQLMNPR